MRRLTTSAATVAAVALAGLLHAVASGAAGRQGPVNVGPVDAISITGLRAHLGFIASDALEGRDALSPGFLTAAQYVAAQLARIGARRAGDAGGYLQAVTIRRTTPDPSSSLAIGDQRFRYGPDFVVRQSGDAKGRLAYVGYGIRVPARSIDPYAGLEVKGKLLIVLSGTPAGVPLTRSKRGVEWFSAEDSARALGARGIIRVGGFRDLARWPWDGARVTARGEADVDRLLPADSPAPLPVITAAPRLVDALFAGEREDGARIAERAATREAGASFALSDAKVAALQLPAAVTRQDTFNVVGIVEGSDPVLKSEYVALGAHLDHLGRVPDANRRGGDEIYNGADDDGSGVVALLEIAEAVARGPRPKRSLLFVWHTGEEEGDWGSRYFTAFPTVPIDSIVTQLNVDMIGRSRGGSSERGGDAELSGPNGVYVVGSKRLSQDLGATVERVNRQYLNLTLDYKYDDPDDPAGIYNRSDHYEYAQKNIPVAFFFSGLHADYHKPSDEIGAIDFQKLQKVTRTVLAVAWTVANAQGRPRIDPPTATH